MASVIYHDLEGVAPRISWGSYSFLDGIPVEVTDEYKLKKMRGNRFFEVGSSDPAPVVEVPPPPDPERVALVAEAEALGITVDGRWGVPRLTEEIAKAKGQ